MKLIDANKLYFDCTTIWGYPAVGKNQIENAPTVSAVLIPDNATNGDVIQAVFPGLDIKKFPTYLRIIHSGDYLLIGYDWWNAPYKRGDTE